MFPPQLTLSFLSFSSFSSVKSLLYARSIRYSFAHSILVQPIFFPAALAETSCRVNFRRRIRCIFERLDIATVDVGYKLVNTSFHVTAQRRVFDALHWYLPRTDETLIEQLKNSIWSVRTAESVFLFIRLDDLNEHNIIIFGGNRLSFGCS